MPLVLLQLLVAMLIINNDESTGRECHHNPDLQYIYIYIYIYMCVYYVCICICLSLPLLCLNKEICVESIISPALPKA